MPKPMRRPFKVPTPDTLANVALYHLSRYAASEQGLRRILENRLIRAAMHIPEFSYDHEKQAQLHLVIETIIERHRKSGALNDKAFAEAKANSLRRTGRSRRDIKMRLGRSGIKGDLIDRALTENEDGADPLEVELKAAVALAKRRRLGPFRAAKKAGEDIAARRRKDFAALARAGFSMDIVRKVIGGELPDEFV